jgi:lysophospholipase L1-like esterase
MTDVSMPWSRVRLVLAAGLLVLTVACSDDDPESAPPESSASTTSTTTTTTEPSTAVTFEPGAKYVALGTSYAAGQGVEKQLETCGRSDHNYPHLLAAELGLDLVDVTCGAASTEHLVDTPQGDIPPQITAVTPDTQLITVTVGGNDVAYSPTAIACGDPANVCAVDQEKLDAAFTGLRTELATLFGDLEAAAPDATIVLVPYVRLVFDAACAELSFTPAEAELVQSIGERLHELSLEVADDAGLRVADPWAEAGDHGPCATGPDKWVDGRISTTGFMYHPTAEGHVAMARLVDENLQE